MQVTIGVDMRQLTSSWCLATVIGWVIGMPFAWVVENWAERQWPGLPWYSAQYDIMVHVPGTLGALCLGVTLGVSQALVIRRALTIHNWLPATAIGWVFSSVMYNQLGQPLAIAQWWLLRRHSRWAWVWPLCSITATVLGIASLNQFFAMLQNPGGFAYVLGAAVLLGVVHGIFTGIGLALIVATAKDESQSPSADTIPKL